MILTVTPEVVPPLEDPLPRVSSVAPPISDLLPTVPRTVLPCIPQVLPPSQLHQITSIPWVVAAVRPLVPADRLYAPIAMTLAGR